MTGNFGQLVHQNMDKFETFARKKIALDAELALAYMDMKDYTVVCVKNSYDITDLEAQRFLEAVEKKVVDFIQSFDQEKRGGSVIINDYMQSSMKDDKKQRQASMSSSASIPAELPVLSMMNEITLKDPKYSSHF